MNQKIVPAEPESLEVAELGKLLRQNGLHLAVAESCTGGLIGHLLTNVAGSSDYFLGGLIAYSNQAKVKLLRVRQETLQLHGAVSRETAIEMANGVRQAFDAEVGLSATGIAGPGGASPEKPIGLTWIGLSTLQTSQAWRQVWRGDRLQIKYQAARHALHLLIDYLHGTN